MTFWGNIQGFECHYFEALEDSPLLEPFASLVSVWRSKFDGKRIPKWSDFDFTDFRGWHSRLAIFDISYEPFDYIIRLSGEEFNSIAGRNMKGVTRNDLMAIAVEDILTDKFYEKASTEMLIAYQKGINVVDREHLAVEFLELPLSDNGLHATHSIEVVFVNPTSKYDTPRYIV